MDHQRALFINNQTGEEYSTFTGVPLGIVRGRVFFPAEVGEGASKPLCKSPDGKTGYPSVNPALPPDKRFPWAKSGFDEDTAPLDIRGHKPLPCDACAFSNWIDNKPPPCSEQWTIPMIYPRVQTDGSTSWDNLILVTFQKSSMTPAKKYVSWFKQNRKPLFSAMVTIGLDQKKRGNVSYVEATFKREADTMREDYPMYADFYSQLAGYLHEPPAPTALNQLNSAPAQQQITAAPAVQAQPAPAATVAPAVQSVAQPAAPVQAAPEPVTEAPPAQPVVAAPAPTVTTQAAPVAHTPAPGLAPPPFVVPANTTPAPPSFTPPSPGPFEANVVEGTVASSDDDDDEIPF
jgi:hypothetical protein